MTASRRNRPDPATLLLTDRQVAERLGVSPRTVREYRYDGALRTVALGYRTVRVRSDDVDKLIRDRTART